MYRAFYRFGQAKLDYGGLVLGYVDPICIHAPAALKMTLDVNGVKMDQKIIILFQLCKSVTHSVVRSPCPGCQQWQPGCWPTHQSEPKG